MKRNPKRWLPAVLLVAVATGCVGPGGAGSSLPSLSSASPSPSGPNMTLSIANHTTIAVTVVVNRKVIETVAAGGYEDPIKAELPGLPWEVETRSPGGRVLSSLTVKSGDVWYKTPDASGNSEAKGDAVRVDLSCGRLDVWSGPPLSGPIFSPGPAGDCA